MAIVIVEGGSMIGYAHYLDVIEKMPIILPEVKVESKRLSDERKIPENILQQIMDIGEILKNIEPTGIDGKNHRKKGKKIKSWNKTKFYQK